MNTSKRKRTPGRLLSLGICTVLLLPLASEGWNTAWAEPLKAPQEQRVLRIGSLWSGEDDTYFRQQFTDMYELQHPEIKLELVSAIDASELRFSSAFPQPNTDNLGSIRGIMGGEHPVDVIIGESQLLKSLAENNLVLPLQPLIDRDHYDISTMAPTMLNGIRELGGGNLFALAPTFSSSALYYNKKIFDAAKVAYPTNGMTWDEMFALAAKVTKVSKKSESRVYGFSMNRYLADPFWDLQTYVSPLKLSQYDNKGEKMTVNNAQWSKAWTTYSGLVKKQTVPGLDSQEFMWTDGKPYSPIQGDLFLTSKAAMVVGEYGYINELTSVHRNASKIKNYKPVDWGVVTVPTYAEKPDVAVGTWLGTMMAIGITATNPEDAWDFIKFVNSKEVAKIKAHNRYELTSRKEYITSQDPNINLEAFYTLKPLPPNDLKMDSLLTQKPAISQVSDAGRQLFIEVFEGKRSVPNALKAWEKQGNAMLLQLITNPQMSFDLENG
ncbi:ABC transporter substrate-binding protein [Paenibacillus wynnii]|uniref:ABC transporter substrate-binding protein n=1 Tax=Paenibacillus wynnii TaxID=268407 RepID=UPI00278E8EB5|nr:extracellular solute-binding protein [Paenibacillus wynnii]MDQ0192546.1 multiple sugar transport system substrate-binding protein [Paenibacillus wynnii]